MLQQNLHINLFIFQKYFQVTTWLKIKDIFIDLNFIKQGRINEEEIKF